jgi:uncharacterized membrane protein YkvA (DUF1232 family)
MIRRRDRSYVIESLDALNFALPFVGLVDDVVLIPMLLHLLLRLLPAEIRAGF